MSITQEQAQYKKYRRSQIAELADWAPGFDMSGVSVSDADKAAGSPKLGDKIARNPANHADRWLVAADYFSVNFEPIQQSAQAAPVQAEPSLEEIAAEVLANRDESVLHDPAWPSRIASPEGEAAYQARRIAIRAFVDSAILPLIGQVLEKRLTQAATFMRDELTAATQPQQAKEGGK